MDIFGEWLRRLEFFTRGRLFDLRSNIRGGSRMRERRSAIGIGPS